MTNIVITGATGVVGRRAVRELLAAGHKVSGVTRSLRGRRLLEARRAPRRGRRLRPVPLTTAFAGADTVVNLLTHVPPADEMTVPGAWHENDRLRREASAAIARAAQDAGAARLVQESLAFLYADGGDAWLDEDAPVAGGDRTAMALTAEANAAAHFSGDTVLLRLGHFIGPDSGLTQSTIEAARGGISPSLAPRDAYRPTVWLDDAARRSPRPRSARPRDLQRGRRGPADQAEIDAALAAVVGRDFLRPATDELSPGLAPVGALAARLHPAVARGDRVDAARACRHRRLAPDH